MSPAELPRIRRKDAGREAAVVGAGEERDRHFVVVGHVELVEAWGRGAVGGGDGFDEGASRGGEAVGEVELLGDGGDEEFALWVVAFVYTGWSEADWGGG